MQPNDGQAKARILAAAVLLLNEGLDPAQMTVRQIATRASVGTGLINYHFQNKDKLINEAVMQIVGSVAASWYEPLQRQDIDPVVRLKRLFRESSIIMARYRKYAEISFSYALLHGDMEVPTLILPLLREIFGSQKSETELRLIAFQLVVAMQAAVVQADALRRYAGIDVFNDIQRDRAIEILVDSVTAVHK